MITYIIECNNGDIYCGKTNDLDRRMCEHNKEKYPHYFSFKSRKPFKLIFISRGDYEEDIKRFGIRKFMDSIDNMYKSVSPTLEGEK